MLGVKDVADMLDFDEQQVRASEHFPPYPNPNPLTPPNPRNAAIDFLPRGYFSVWYVCTIETAFLLSRLTVSGGALRLFSFPALL